MLSMFNTSWDVAKSNVDTAVLPLGSVEPKGPHLPVGLDLILANRFARDFCRGQAIYLLPVFPYSSAMETRVSGARSPLGSKPSGMCCMTWAPTWPGMISNG